MSRKQKHRIKPEAFTYTKPQANEILAALRKAGLPENANHTSLLSEITKLARNALMGKGFEDEFHGPAGKRVRAKIRRVAKGAETLLANIETMGPDAEWSLEEYFLRSSGDPLISNLTPTRLRSLLAYTAKWGKNPTRRGRHEKAWERSFVRVLSTIYFSVTGRVPSRRHNYITGEEYGPFRAFVHAVMEPTGLLPSPTTVDHLIRLVTKEFPPKHPPVTVKIRPSFR